MYVVVQFCPLFNFIFLSFNLIIIHFQTPKQRKMKIKPRIKLSHNIYIGMFLNNTLKFNSLLACSLRASSPIWASEKRVSRERASERRSRDGQGKGELATISHKISFVLRPDEGKYHWLKNDVPEIKVD